MSRAFSLLGTALLAAFLLTACEEPARYKVLESGDVKEYSPTELEAAVVGGRLGDTSLVFNGQEWIAFRDYPVTAELLARHSKSVSAAPAASSTSVAAVPPVLTINASNPGAEVDIMPHLVPGRIVIFDFYSEYCPPCVRIAPTLEKLATVRPEYVIRKIDINRPGGRGIDWGSPAARQYRLESIPHFKIYDAEGRLTAEGDHASQIIDNLLAKI